MCTVYTYTTDVYVYDMYYACGLEHTYIPNRTYDKQAKLSYVYAYVYMDMRMYMRTYIINVHLPVHNFDTIPYCNCCKLLVLKEFVNETNLGLLAIICNSFRSAPSIPTA